MIVVKVRRLVASQRGIMLIISELPMLVLTMTTTMTVIMAMLPKLKNGRDADNRRKDTPLPRRRR